VQSHILPRLEARIPFLFFGLTGIMHFVVDLLVLWDVQAVAMIESVTIKHRQALLDTIDALGEAEFIACLGTYAWEERGTVQPIVDDDAPHLEIVDGRHPLIDRESAVANTLRLGAPVRTWIITGSNMSGKSTFLRMTATNALLAMIGSRVPAAAMRLSPLEILTDLRIRDDLSRKESYFLAEVRQVRRMVDAARAGRPILTLIDEPFRGTNSGERVAAASAVVRSLIAGSGLHLVATHDAALTALGDCDRAANYHFEEQFENDGLVFDYRLRDGQARTRNALRVLAVEGYPKDVVEDARNTAAILAQAEEAQRCQ
jgi:DNA mismatch repair ATPase MutS